MATSSPPGADAQDRPGLRSAGRSPDGDVGSRQTTARAASGDRLADVVRPVAERRRRVGSRRRTRRRPGPASRPAGRAGRRCGSARPGARRWPSRRRTRRSPSWSARRCRSRPCTGRAHPFGQPVMFRRMAASPLPVSASAFSRSLTRSGSTRSASPRAWPHVGRAGQAIDSRRSGADVAGELDAVGPQTLLDDVGAPVGDPVQQQVLAGGHGDLGDESVGDERAQRACAGATPSRSAILPDGTGSPTTPSRVPWYSSGTHGACSASGASSKPTRRPTSARTQSMPRSSTRYLSRARWRSSRLPKSRCVVTTASTTSTTCSGVDPAERLGEQRVGVVLAGVAHAEPAADVDVVAGDVAGRAVGERRARCRRRWPARRRCCRPARPR